MPTPCLSDADGDFAALEGESDVVVVGGGAVGASVAYHLARSGRRVTLIERGEWCAGTSGATFAWVGAHGQTPLSYHFFRRESIRRYETLGAEIGTDVEYRPMPSFELIETRQEWRHAAEKVRRMQDEGYALRIVSAEELYQLEPHLARRFAGATLCPIGGVINPFRLTLGLLRAASKAGAVLIPHTELRSTTVRRGRISSLVTSRGGLRAQVVVLATGVATGAIARELGIVIPMRPVRGQLLVTEPLPPLFFHIISDVRQTASGNVLIGRTDEEGQEAPDTTADGMAWLAGRILRMAPMLRGVKVVRSYAGMRPMPADEMPILGSVAGVKGLLVAVMHSGITLAALVGELICQLVAEGHTRVPIQDYSLERFSGSGLYAT